MSAEIIELDAARIAPFLVRAIEGFLADPPDSDYQRGYLAGLIITYREGLGRGKDDDRIKAAERLIG